MSSLEMALPRWRKVDALPLAVIVYAATAAAVAPETYIAMVGLYAHQAIVLPPIVAVGLAVAALLVRPEAPLVYLRDKLRALGVRFLGAVGCICIGLSAFTTFKLAIPSLVPFYADPFFADLDAWLHGGNPGDILHAVLPAWLHYPLGYLYGPTWFLLWFGLMAFVALRDDRQLRRRYFWSMALAVCLLGTLLATASSSVGPVFYDRFFPGGRFAALMASIEASAIGDYMAAASGYLFANYEAGGHHAGTGISAMPSMHLAIVTLNALMLTGIDKRIGSLAWIYVVLILVGSVLLGWHYAIDGYFSIVAVAIIWWVMGRFFPRETI